MIDRILFALSTLILLLLTTGRPSPPASAATATPAIISWVKRLARPN